MRGPLRANSRPRLLNVQRDFRPLVPPLYCHEIEFSFVINCKWQLSCSRHVISLSRPIARNGLRTGAATLRSGNPTFASGWFGNYRALQRAAAQLTAVGCATKARMFITKETRLVDGIMRTCWKSASRRTFASYRHSRPPFMWKLTKWPLTFTLRAKCRR